LQDARRGQWSTESGARPWIPMVCCEREFDDSLDWTRPDSIPPATMIYSSRRFSPHTPRAKGGSESMASRTSSGEAFGDWEGYRDIGRDWEVREDSGLHGAPLGTCIAQGEDGDDDTAARMVEIRRYWSNEFWARITSKPCQ
jgi:hypothetical protein